MSAQQSFDSCAIAGSPVPMCMCSLLWARWVLGAGNVGRIAHAWISTGWMLHNHVDTCFSQAVVEGQGERAIEELVDALKFSPALTGPDTVLNGTTADEVGTTRPA
jgi:hypothetical protein